MANWAETTYIIEGNSDDLKKIHNALEIPVVYKDSSKNWEGNVLITLGLNYDKAKRHYLRGFIEDYYYDDTIRIYAEEVWGLSDFSQLLQELFPYINIYWYVEEPGCNVYATNDASGIYFPQRYYIEYIKYGDTSEISYAEDEEDLFSITSELTNGKVTDKKSLEEFNNNDEEYFIIQKVEVK